MSRLSESGFSVSFRFASGVGFVRIEVLSFSRKLELLLFQEVRFVEIKVLSFSRCFGCSFFRKFNLSELQF